MPSLIFPNLDSWEAWVDNNIITNGMELITGDFGNITENAAIQFIRQSPLNWQKAKIESLGGAVVASRPIIVFMTTAPTSLTWADNIYYEYVFINTTNSDIPSNTYYDINLTAITIVPAKSIINIAKASNDLWIIKSVPSSGSGTGALPPLTGLVGGGGADDPTDGATTYQNNKLIGVGATNAGKVTIIYAETPMSSWGDNAAFTLNSTSGLFTWLNGNTFSNGSSFYVDRNQ